MVGGQLMVVSFYGDELQVVHDDGKVWVGFKKLCQNIGLTLQSQFSKIKDCVWATTKLIVTVAQDGKNRSVLMLEAESVPLWLATINPSRAAPAVRPKLELYQREVKGFLAEKVFGKQNAPKSPFDLTGDVVTNMIHVSLAMREEQLALKSQVNQLGEVQLAITESQSMINQRCDELATTIRRGISEFHYRIDEVSKGVDEAKRLGKAAFDTLSGNFGYYSVLGYNKLLGRDVDLKTAQKDGTALSNMARDRGITINKVLQGYHGYVNCYPEDLLKEYYGMEANKPNLFEEKPVPVVKQVYPSPERPSTNSGLNLPPIIKGKQYTERRERITAAIKENPHWSDPLIAAKCKVSNTTASKVRSELEIDGIVPPVPLRMGRDGRYRKSQQEK